ncbi:MAG TPA: NUDIX domain-containing protein [Vicinamibacterales bacterium]
MRVEQAGGIAVRKSGGRWTVLLVRAKKDPRIWIFPKGHIEPGETPDQTALRETQEEGGVDGELMGPVGKPLEFQSGAEAVRVQYFLIRAQQEVDSPEGRVKAWFPLDEAAAQLSYDNARALVVAARKALDLR